MRLRLIIPSVAFMGTCSLYYVKWKAEKRSDIKVLTPYIHLNPHCITKLLYVHFRALIRACYKLWLYVNAFMSSMVPLPVAKAIS
jgi:hypothetical protein